MADMSPELFAEIETLEQKHAENPGGRYFVPLANAYRKAGRVDQAETLIRDGLEYHPDYLSAHVVLGRCLRERGADGEAEETFRRVLETDPQNLVALRSLGELAADGGRSEEARDWYQRLLSIDPMNEEARSALDSLAEEDRAHPIDVEPAGGDGLDLSLEAQPHPVEEDAPWISGDEAPQAAGDDGLGLDAVDVDAVDVEAFEIGEPAGASAVEGGGDLESLEVETAYEGEDEVEVTAYETHGGRDTGEADPIEEEDLGLLTFEDPLDTDDVSIAGGSAESESWSEVDGGEVAGDAAPTGAGFGDDLDFDGDDLDFDIAGEDQLSAHPGGREEGPATLTMADLYARQGFHDRAAEVYRRLLSERGEDPEIRAKLEEAESRIAEEADEETLHTDAFADSVSEGFAVEGADADAHAGSGLGGESQAGGDQEMSAFFAAAGEMPAAEAADAGEFGGDRGTDEATGSTETIGAFLARLTAWRPGQPDVEPETEEGADSPASSLSEDAGDHAGTDAHDTSWGADEEEAWTAAQSTEVSHEESEPQDASPWVEDFDEAEIEGESALDASAGTPAPSPWDASVEDEDSSDEDATLGPDAWDEEPAGPSPWDPPVEEDEPEDVAGAAGEADAGPVTDAEWEEVRPESEPSAAKDESEEGSPGSGDEAVPAMPWEASDDEPTAAAERQEPGAEEEDDALAIERLFAAGPASEEPPQESPDPQASAGSEEEGESDDGDDDLESFQAWLQSLKT